MLSMSRFCFYAFFISLNILLPTKSYSVAKEVFTDWQVDCANDLTCKISYAAKGNSGEVFDMEFIRGPSKEDPLKLSLPILLQSNENNKADSVFEFNVDGRMISTIELARLSIDHIKERAVFADQKEIFALLGAMKGGQSMTVTYKNNDDQFDFVVSLSGLTSAGFFTDVTQGRADRADALQTRNNTSVSTGATIRVLSKFADIPEDIRGDFASETGACYFEESLMERYENFEIMFPDGNRVLLALCGEPDNYNPSYAIYTGRERLLRTAFPSVKDGHPTIEDQAYNVGYDINEKRLKALFQMRGSSDCGDYMVWHLDSQNGVMIFYLEEQRVKDGCDGDDKGGPQNWPLIWPLKK